MKPNIRDTYLNYLPANQLNVIIKLYIFSSGGGKIRFIHRVFLCEGPSAVSTRSVAENQGE